jgi:hypothetical protein
MREFLILVTDIAVVTTITTMPIKQTLNVGTFLQRRLQVRDSHPLPSSERQLQEVGIRQFSNEDGKNGADVGGS